MPPKNGKENLKKKNIRGSQNAVDASKVVQALMKAYEANCLQYNQPLYAPLKRQMKQNIEDSKLQVRFLFEGSDRDATSYWEDEKLPDIFNQEVQYVSGIKVRSHTDLIRILPILDAIRNLRYIYVQEFLVWGIIMEQQEIICLVCLSSIILARRIYQLVRLELIDCLIDEKAIGVLAPSINRCSTLRELVLDCNEFGDAGCLTLCSELRMATFLYQLSLNHCSITKVSAYVLGDMVSFSTIRELFLEGNSLYNEGVIIMVGVIVTAISNEVPSFKGEYYEIRKSTKKVDKTVFLPKGPDICKLNLANNNIGRFGPTQQFAPVLSMQLIKRLISTCKDLEEVDLFANDIGDVAARVILEGLTIRKMNKYPQIGIRMCHLVNQDLYDTITKMAPGSKKKKRKG